eukprot:890897-Amphidinium_carterae.1
MVGSPFLSRQEKPRNKPLPNIKSQKYGHRTIRQDKCFEPALVDARRDVACAQLKLVSLCCKLHASKATIAVAVAKWPWHWLLKVNANFITTVTVAKYPQLQNFNKAHPNPKREEAKDVEQFVTTLLQ